MNTHDFIRDVTDFIFIEDAPRQADIIFIPGGSTPSLPRRAAELYADGFAPLLCPSGKYSVRLGHFRGVTDEAEVYGGDYGTECEFYTSVLKRHGVPECAIIGEDESEYTCQNADFSARLLGARGIKVASALLVCKAFHARRALTYYQAAFPNTSIYVVPVVTSGISRGEWMNTDVGQKRVLGELKRLGEQMADTIKAETTRNNEKK